MKLFKNLKLKIKNLYRWATATRLRKILSSILAVLIFITSIRFIFLPPKEVHAAEVILGLNEGYGATTNDTNNSVPALTISGATWKSDDLCYKGKCLYFDGSDQVYVLDANTNGSLDFDYTESFTVTTWFRHNSSFNGNSEDMVAKSNFDDVDGGWRLQFDASGTISAKLDDADADSADDDIITTPGTYGDNQWHQVAFVKTANTSIKLYIDGSEVATAVPTVSSTLANDDRFSLGLREDTTTPNTYYTGFLDEVKVFRSARTADEIKTDYLGTSLGTSGPGPIGYYRMDESSWNNNCSTLTVFDTSGGANNGISCPATTGPTTPAAGKFGNAGVFDGTDDYVEVNQSWKSSLTSFTASMWVYINTLNGTTAEQYHLYQRLNGETSYPRLRILGDGRVTSQLSISGNTTDASTTLSNVVTANEWYFLTTSYNNEEEKVKIYINGQLVHTEAVPSGTLDGGTNNLRIGHSGVTAGYFNGKIDDFRIYNYVRSDAQVLEDMAYNPPSGSSVSFEPDQSWVSNGLVGYWKMDENTGTSASDLSGSSNTLTLSASSWSMGKFGSSWNGDATKWLSRTDDDEFDFTQNDSFSISAWFKSDSATNPAANEFLVDKENASPGYGLYFTTNGHPTFGVDDDTVFDPQDDSAESPTDYYDGNWHHVVAVKTGLNSIEIFVDGILSATDNSLSATGTLINTDVITIGAQDTSAGTTGDEFGGDIDDVRIYRRALNNTEIERLYNWGPGPLGYWKMDENSGTSTTNDSSTFGNALSLAGGINDWNQCKFGSCLKFDGVDDQLISTATSTFDMLPQMTLSAWVYSYDGSYAINARFITKNPTNTSGWIFSWGTTNRLVFNMNYSTSSLQVRAFTLSPNTWYHVAVTWDGSQTATGTKLFLNGVEATSYVEQTDGVGTRVDDSANEVSVGVSGSGNTGPFDGFIDDVRVYNYQRTAAQIVEDMNGGHPAPGSPIGSPLGYWKLDEGYGTTANDSSINADNLTLSNASWTNNGKFSRAWNGTGANWFCSGSGSCADDDNFDFGSDSFSLSLWYKSDSATNPATQEDLIAKNNTTNPGYGIIINTQGKVGFQIDDDITFDPDDSVGTISSQADTYDNTWHNVVAVKNGTTSISIYSDGQLVETKTGLVATGSLSNTLALIIGDRNGTDNGNEFTGDIDEVKIYKFALTSEEVRVEYNSASGAYLGATSTDSSGNATWSAQREYCPPGNTESNCAAGLDPSPVGYWKLDENTGTSAFDSSENDNTGTLTNGPDWIPAKNGPGIFLDPETNNKYISVPSSASLDNLSQFTWEAWVNPHLLQNQTALSKGGTVQLHMQSISGGLRTQLFINCSGATDLSKLSSSVDDMSLDEWHHVSITWDGTSCLLNSTNVYIDGKPTLVHVNSTDGAGSKNSEAGSPFYIGNYGGGLTGQFRGSIDDVRVYNYVRTPAQIAWSYNKGGPIFGFRMDEGSGDTLNNYGSEGSVGNGNMAGATTCPATGACPAWSTSGKYNNALNFDNTDDFVSFSNTKFPTGDFSVSAWVNSTGTTNDTIFSGHTAAGGDELKIMENNSNQIDVQIDSTTSFTTTQTLSNNVWNHIVVTRSGSSIKVYINGSLDPTTGTDPDALNFETCDMIIGLDYDGGCSLTAVSPYGGLIDDVEVFDYALSTKQVQLLYDEGASVKTAQ